MNLTSKKKKNLTQEYILFMKCLKYPKQDFPGGLVVKTVASTTGGRGSTPGGEVPQCRAVRPKR